MGVLYSEGVEDRYRSAASVVVVRPAADGASPGPYHVLLLHKPRKKDSWQLPQGGCEAGETIKQAALRELGEEAGITEVDYLGESEKIYQYDFPASFRRFRPDEVCGQKIQFVFAKVAPTTVVKVDEHEIDKYVWVTPQQVRNYIKRTEYLSLIEILIAEAVAQASR